jgi:TolA-binding protein
MRHFISTRISRGAVLAVALVSASACATKNDVRDLQGDLQAELRAINARQDSLFSALLATQDATQDATERGLLDTRGEITTQLRSLTQETRQLAEFVGQIQISVDNLADRIDRLERGGTTLSRPSAADPRDGLLAPGIGGDADADYRTALDLYRGGQLFGAQQAFEDFLADHPNDELVPRVHFNLGDVHQQNGDFDDAIASFERVGELFPDAQEVVQAQYRIGVIHMEQGDDDDARRVFQRIINTWGDSDDFLASGVVQDARERLRELGG